MYCIHCGTQLIDNSKFCNQCGNPTQIQQTAPQVPISQPLQTDINPIYNSTIQVRHNYNRGLIVKNTLITIAVCLLCICEIFLCLDTSTINEPLIKNPDTAATVLTLLLIGDLIWILCLSISSIQVKKSFICVTDKGIYGVGSSNNFFTTKAFAYSYSEITSVYAGNTGIIIGSGGSKITCLITQSYKALGLIRKNIITADRNQQRYTWFCNKCGTTNRYAGNVCSSCKTKRKTAKPQEAIAKLINDIAIAVNYCKNKTDFISAMTKFGYSVNWKETDQNITFFTPDGSFFTDSDIPDARYHKNNLEQMFRN